MGRFYSDILEKGIELLYFQCDETKYAEGVRLVQQACDNNEPDAYYIMARCYAWEDGKVEGDEEKAISYSQKGAELGSDLCILGADRFDELDAIRPYMKHSLEEALNAVTEMAKKGNPVAQYAVGLFYYWGDATMLQLSKGQKNLEKLKAQNGAESTKWYEMAAQQGHIPAFRNLYVSVSEGSNGVVKNQNKAFKYAEDLKNKVQIPGSMCDTIAGDYEDIRNYAKMVEWYQRGIAAGGLNSINNLGCSYLDGNGVKQDYQKAIEHFQMGYQKGEPFATHNLGRCYFFGWGCKEDKGKAFELFSIAAEKEQKVSQCFLAQYYEEGLAGVPVDYEKCRMWAERSVANGWNRAKYYLGKCYLYGYGIPANPQLALALLTECAQSFNDGKAYRVLGEAYEKGLGVPVDNNKAATNYQNAIKCGCEAAKENLSHFKKGFFGGWKRV